jgi:hypothetical protein
LISTGAYIGSLISVVAVCVTAIVAIVKLMGDRVTDQTTRVVSLETRVGALEKSGNDRHDVIMAKLNGIGETLARFDQRLEHIEGR